MDFEVHKYIIFYLDDMNLNFKFKFENACHEINRDLIAKISVVKNGQS